MICNNKMCVHVSCAETQLVPSVSFKSNSNTDTGQSVKNMESPYVDEAFQKITENVSTNSACIWDEKSLKNHANCVLLNFKYNSDYCYYNKPSALYYYLNPVLEDLLELPDSSHFLNPVDVIQLQIPDYYNIIKNPMDLSTIKKKLLSGEYQDGWEFVDDIWLMFNNAWLYNKKTTRVYKSCLKLADKFKLKIDLQMKHLGYCCGQYYTFGPKILFCISKKGCIISKYASYWNYKDRYQLCNKCYLGIQSDTVVFRNSSETITINKEDFVLKINDVKKKELYVECSNCGIRWHKICAFYLEHIWKDGFLCNFCGGDYTRQVLNKFTSENLQRTKLDSYIEERVNNFLKNEGCNSKVVIRLVYNAKKSLYVKKDAKSKFVDAGIWPEQFPYLSKTLLAFQKIDGLDVCFFSMFVQEYNSQCLQPNTRRVYLSYLDSIHFFSPKELRTFVYYEILLGYFDYVRNLGYTKVHLWACPPKDGEDYAFYCHPSEQKTPCVKKLLEWYKIVLDKAIEKKIVKKYKNIYTEAVEDNLKDVSELPYFEGDCLPSTLEKEIPKLGESSDSEIVGIPVTKTRLSAVNEQKNQNLNKSKEKIPIAKCRKSKKNLKPIKCISSYTVGDPLTDRILSFLQYHKEGFLVIHLDHSISEPDLPAIIDPDPVVLSGVMCSREAFLEFCRENDHEFSSLRRAKYSTMALLYELHRENTDTISCNHCKKILAVGYHCAVCKDFDLCSDCYNLNGHEHQMEDLKIDSVSKSCMFLPNSYEDKCTVFDHISACNDASCQTKFCKLYKKLAGHYATCSVGRYSCKYCSFCIRSLNKHSKNCKKVHCLIQECRKIKSLSRNWSQNVKSNQNCTLNSRNFLRFCNSGTICIYDEGKSSSKTSSADGKIPPIYNQQSSTFINCSKTAVVNDYLSCASTAVGKASEIKTESRNTNLEKTECQSNFTKITEIRPKNELKNHQTQTFIMSNNGLVLDTRENALQYDNIQKMDVIVSSNKQSFKTENIQNSNICDDETDFSSMPHLTSGLQTVSFTSDIQQNNRNILHPKLKFSDGSIHNKRYNRILSHQTRPHSDYISDTSLKRKLSSDFSEHQSLPSKSVHMHNAAIKVEDCNSNLYAFPLNTKNAENAVLNVSSSDCTSQVFAISAKQQPFVSLVAPKEQTSSKHEKLETYSDIQNFTFNLQNYKSANISNARKPISLSCNKTKQSNLKTACSTTEKYLTSDMQKIYCPSVSPENNYPNLSLNETTNGFPIPIYSKVEQNTVIPLNKSNCSLTDSPKVTTCETVKSIEGACRIDSVLNFKCNIPGTSNVNIRNNENLADSCTLGQNKLCKSLNEKQSKVAPEQIQLKFNKYYLTSVIPASTSIKNNSSISRKNIECLIPNTFKVISSPVNPEPDNSEISVKPFSNAGEISNLQKNKIVISTNKHSTIFPLTENKKHSSCSKLHLVTLKKPRFEKCKDNAMQTEQASNSTFSPVASNICKDMTYSILNSTLNCAQFSVNKEVPLSMECKLPKLEMESKPLVSSCNTNSPSLGSNKTKFKNYLMLEKSNLNLNQIHSKQINCAAEIGCESNSKSYQTFPSKSNSMDTKTVNETKNLYYFPGDYSVYQTFKSNIVQQHCQESFLSKNNCQSNDDKTLPAFEDICKSPNFDILKGKELHSTHDQFSSENLQTQMQNVPSYSVPSKTSHGGETYLNESDELHLETSTGIAKVTAQVPNFTTVTSCTPNMHVVSKNGTFNSSSSNFRNEQKSVIYTFVNPNAVCDYKDQNTLCIKNSTAEKPLQNATPIHILPDMISKYQNTVPCDYYSTSTVNNTQSQAISKSNKMTFLSSLPIQSTSRSLDINEKNVIYLTSGSSNNISSASNENGCFKQESILLLDNILKPVNFQHNETSASNSVELSLNGSQVPYSSQVPFVYSYNMENPVISSQNTPLFEPQNSGKNLNETHYKDSCNRDNNLFKLRSLFTERKFCDSFQAQPSSHDQSQVYKIAAFPVQHSHLPQAFLNPNQFQRNCTSMQKIKLKPSQVTKRMSRGKRGRKKSGSIT